MNNSEIQRNKVKYGIIGNSDGLNDALNRALQVANTDLSVLITGENGSGKEVIPRLIHDNSSRKHKKYMAVNCASIPEGTLDSELFGHVKGAFTGAISDREGYFASANGGTLFLDEVGELPLSTQARLLRVLETGEYIPVGSSTVKKTDVRIVAATNINFQKAISERRFREDLYYRLNQIPISIPPLRDRGDDIIKLFMKFAMDMADKYNMPPIVLAEDAKPLLLEYKWPGNVRQLRNITEQISVISEERTITRAILERYVPKNAPSTNLTELHPHKADDHSFSEERDVIYSILYDLRNKVNELNSRVTALEGGKTTVSQEVKSMPVSLPAPVGNNVTVSSNEQSKHEDVNTDWVDAEEVESAADGELTAVELAEKHMIMDALRKHHNRRKAVADALNFSERTLYRKMKKYDLE